MKGKDLLTGMSFVDEKFIEEAGNGNIAGKKQGQSGRITLKKTLLIAAVISAMVLLMGCAVYVLQMQDLRIGEREFTVEVFDDDNENNLREETVSQQVLTIAGLKGTTGYQAAQEWYDFMQGYDPENKILSSVWGNYPEFPEEYTAYDPYSQEMVDKIDEIAEKYDLKLLGAPVEARTTKLLCEAVGLERVLVPDSEATMTMQGLKYYEGGSFTMSFDMRMPEGEGMWPYDIMGNLYYSNKAYFNTDSIYLDNTDDWREWTYTTASGEEVLILRSPSSWKAWIFCDRNECTISMMVEAIREAYSEVDGVVTVDSVEMTDRQLEMVADAIDFTLTPKELDSDADLTGTAGGNVQIQNGYTVELKSAVTDGYIAYLTLDITAPEGVVLMNPDIEHYNVLPGNSDCFEPVQELENFVSSSGYQEMLEDQDGLDNTLTIVIGKEVYCDNGEKPFAAGNVWNLYIENLVGSYYDSEAWSMREELLAEGVWNFDIRFEDCDFREIELIREPVTMQACTGWRLDGADVWEDVEVTSFKLRTYSASIECSRNYNNLTDYETHKIYVVMKDGSKLELMETGRYLEPEAPIDLDQVDYVLLTDGTKLMVPESSD